MIISRIIPFIYYLRYISKRLYFKLMDTILSWLEQHMLPCFYKHFLGVECPGCGMQRSIIALLKGNLYESFLLYPPLLPFLTLLVLLITQLLFKFKYGAQTLKWVFIFNAMVIVINYLYKIILAFQLMC